MGSASYLLEGPFLGDRVIYSGGGCFAVRPRLLCVVSNPLRPGISRSPQTCSSLFFCPCRSSMLARLLACPLLALLLIYRETRGGCIASLGAVASPVKGSVNTSTHFMEFLGTSGKRVCLEILASA